MENEGAKLRSLMKSKGYDIIRLANALKVTRVAVEKDLKKAFLTRRSLVKYVPILLKSVDDFYPNQTVETTKVEKDREGTVEREREGSTVALEIYASLQAKYIEQQERYIALQADYLELTKRFFPSAVHRVSLTA